MRMPRPTARLRLTMLYGALFLVTGAIMLLITYLLVDNTSGGTVSYTLSNGVQGSITIGPGGEGAGTVKRFGSSGDLPAPTFTGPGPESGLSTLPDQLSTDGPGAPPQDLSPDFLQTLADKQRTSQLHQLLKNSAFALAGMAVLSIVAGWFLAGRVLSPLRSINARARRISASNLHERVSVSGPDDEFKELGETLDELLDRLESSFQAQRHFVANASHELRTPLAVERSLIQVALADPDADAASLRRTCEQLLESGRKNERLIEALLTLASSESGVQEWTDLDLAEIVGGVVEAHRHEAESRGIALTTDLSTANVSGDRHLVECLAANLVENALHYNVASGDIEVRVVSTGAGASLTVINSGPLVDAEEIARLVQPFQRLARERTARSEGHGLGLSIVKAITSAHGGELEVLPGPSGGLSVMVTLPSQAA